MCIGLDACDLDVGTVRPIGCFERGIGRDARRVDRGSVGPELANERKTARRQQHANRDDAAGTRGSVRRQDLLDPVERFGDIDAENGAAGLDGDSQTEPIAVEVA